MSKHDNHTKEFIIGIGSLLVGVGIRVLTRKLWTHAKGKPPPENPAQAGVKTGEAIVWTLSLAILSGLGKMLLKKKFSEIMPEDSYEVENITKNLNE